MARIEFQDNLEEQISQLEGLRRGAVKRIVMAGADACAEAEKQAIEEYHHVGRTGSMRENVRPGAYHESVGSGSVNVYPQGEDRINGPQAAEGVRLHPDRCHFDILHFLDSPAGAEEGRQKGQQYMGQVFLHSRNNFHVLQI